MQGASNFGSVMRRIGANIVAFIKIKDPGPYMIASFLTGAATLFVIAYALGNWV